MRKPHANARALRRAMPEGERRIWARLRNRALGGLRFRRQHTIGAYIVDFACLDAMLVVEIDGAQHGRGDGPTRDVARDAAIEAAGFLVLRFWNRDVATDIDTALRTIHRHAEERSNAIRAGLL